MRAIVKFPSREMSDISEREKLRREYARLDDEISTLRAAREDVRRRAVKMDDEESARALAPISGVVWLLIAVFVFICYPYWLWNGSLYPIEEDLEDRVNHWFAKALGFVSWIA